MPESGPIIAVLRSAWLTKLGVERLLQAHGAKLLLLESVTSIDSALVSGQRLLLVVPAITDDANAGYRNVREVRKKYDSDSIIIALICVTLNDVQRTWAARQGVDRTFALPEDEGALLGFVSDYIANTGGVLRQKFTPAFLREVADRLGTYVGPIATVFVDEAAKGAGSVDQLYAHLAKYIDNPSAQTAFVESMASELPTDLGETAGLQLNKKEEAHAQNPSITLNGDTSRDITKSALTEANAALTEYIGPIATMMVEEAAAVATSKDDLYERLSENISDPTDRENFLQAAKQ